MSDSSYFCPVCDYGELTKQEPEYDIIFYECDCCNYKIEEKNLQLNIDAVHKDNLN